MKDMRVLGLTIKKMADARQVSVEDLAKAAECTPVQMEMGMMGRGIFSFFQLEKIADRLKVAVESLVQGDEEYYQKNMVDCMTEFTNEKNKEKVLDLIYDYLAVLDCTEDA